MAPISSPVSKIPENMNIQILFISLKLTCKTQDVSYFTVRTILRVYTLQASHPHVEAEYWTGIGPQTVCDATNHAVGPPYQIRFAVNRENLHFLQ